jgi:hypothetical protein
MTALAMYRGGPNPNPPPIPWRRMAWTEWRKQRITLAGVTGLFAVASLYLLATGLSIHHAYEAVSICRPRGAGLCQQVMRNFSQTFSYNAGVAAALMQALPALVGAFAGAPVLARELETGTFRYAWTQGFGRVRWTMATLAPLALAVAALAGAFGLVYSWCYGPLVAVSAESPLRPTMFDLHGVAIAAWTLLAFAIGSLAGMIARRVVPAMAATLATLAGLAFVTDAFLRQHYMAPLVTSNPNVSDPAWVINQWWSHNGHPVGSTVINQILQPVGVRQLAPGSYQAHGPVPGNFDPINYLLQRGYELQTSYEPATRFWTFQWVEGSWLLVLSGLLLAATIWLVRHRAV